MSCWCKCRSQNAVGKTSMVNFVFLMLVFASLAIANAALFFTLSHNLAAGVYPAETDSIALPLMDGLKSSAFLLALLSAAIYIPKRSAMGAAVCAGLCVTALLLAVKLAAQWMQPLHYPISLGFGGVAVVGAFLSLCALRKLVLNIAGGRVSQAAAQSSV